MPEPAKLIIKAAKSGVLGTLKLLLARDASWLNARDSDGSTSLHLCDVERTSVRRRGLLEAGADMNAMNQNEHWGTTPLHAAAHANQAEIAKMLLDHGADLKAKVARRCFTRLFIKRKRWQSCCNRSKINHRSGNRDVSANTIGAFQEEPLGVSRGDVFICAWNLSR
jgi:ankyrin repeat protein